MTTRDENAPGAARSARAASNAVGKGQDWDPADPEISNAIRAPLHSELLGRSAALREVNEMVQRLAQTTLTVLISGESGTGKDIVARALHKLSPRQGKPFVKVNCPAIPESILESELFGYERGAFTGARTSKPGRFEIANHGTLFLDEIAETSFTVQGKLLQVFDGEPFLRIGGVKPVSVDVRVIAATNAVLEDAVRERRLREDMYFRLSEAILRLPSLRECPEDIPLLAEHFNYNYSQKLGRAYRPLAADVLVEMQRLSWPGNVRELGGRVKKYVATEDPSFLLREDGEAASAPAGDMRDALPGRDRNGGASLERAQRAPIHRQRALPEKAPETPLGEREFVPLKEAVRRAVESTELKLIEEALRLTRWNRRRAAKLLRISYSSLLRRIETYNIGKR